MSTTVTPSHVIMVDGAFLPAREAKVGAALSAGVITKVTETAGSVINPVTASGTILAAGPTGAPVLASVYGEWIADYFLGVATYPLPYSLGSALAYRARGVRLESRELFPAFFLSACNLHASFAASISFANFFSSSILDVLKTATKS